MELQKVISDIKTALRKEEEAQNKAWQVGNNSIAELRKEGKIVYPIHVQKITYGYGDYPVLHFSFPYDLEGRFFTNGQPISLFGSDTDETIKGTWIGNQPRSGEAIFYADDLSNFIAESEKIGIQLVPDEKSFRMMHGVLQAIENNELPHLTKQFAQINGLQTIAKDEFQEKEAVFQPKKESFKALNPSQQKAVAAILGCENLLIVHGPPGTGKTTTLCAAVEELVAEDKKVLIAAPSNAAVDFFAHKLSQLDISYLRLGNSLRVNEEIWKNTPDGLLHQPVIAKQLKKLQIQMQSYRKMAAQYKRNFGQAERTQRQLLRKEAKALQHEIKALSDYHLQQYLEKVNVVLGTPVSLQEAWVKNQQFDVFILDEAGQCLLPLALLGMQKAPVTVMAGDPFQLPPTVIDQAAADLGLSISILEKGFENDLPQLLLDTQYRMGEKIAGFSNSYFYDNRLKSATNYHGEITFIDTAGANFTEQKDNGSAFNIKEAEFIKDYLEAENITTQDTVILSPYAAQIQVLKSTVAMYKVSTIDAFQGQEADTIVISLVRANESGTIGFLKDYRRMNVALTRAKQRLIVIGDSATIANDEFYHAFLNYVEAKGTYDSVFSFPFTSY